MLRPYAPEKAQTSAGVVEKHSQLPSYFFSLFLIASLCDFVGMMSWWAAAQRWAMPPNWLSRVTCLSCKTWKKASDSRIMVVCNGWQFWNLFMKFTMLSALSLLCSGVLRLPPATAERKEGGNLVRGGRPSTVLLQQRIPTGGVFCSRVPVDWPVVRRGGEMRGSEYE